MPEAANEFLETRLSLLARLKQLDDQASWQEFVKLYGRLLYSVASRSGLTPEEADEAVQETLISVAKTMPGFKYDPSVCSFKNWLRHLAHKRIADQFRKRPPAGVSAPTLPPGATSQTAPLDRIPDPRKERISPEQFQIFDCYAFKQWPVKEVTQLLGVSSTQVYLAKFRVLRLLRKEVRRLERGRI